MEKKPEEKAQMAVKIKKKSSVRCSLLFYYCRNETDNNLSSVEKDRESWFICVIMWLHCNKLEIMRYYRLHVYCTLS